MAKRTEYAEMVSRMRKLDNELAKKKLESKKAKEKKSASKA